MVAELKEDRQLLPSRPSPILARLGDARALKLRDSCVDVVLTSPPYCTRIDYAKQTSFELAALARLGERQAICLRKELMGTTSLRDTSPGIQLPRSVRAVLERIRVHGSHRSAEYYYPNFRQYFEDAFRGVREIARVTRSGGRAILVLQNSYYKEIPIRLSDLFCELGRSAGLVSQVIVRKDVPRAMTSVNTRARKYRATRKYSEDLVLMEKP